MVRPVIGALALLLALAGCGGDPQADPSPTTSVTKPVSTTPSATATVPVLPTAAAANTKAGAKAFVKYYVELINHAQATGDVTELARAEDVGCESCESVRQSIVQIYKAGGSITGGAWRPHINIALHNKDGSWLVSGYFEFDPEEVRRSEDAAPEANAGGSAITHLTVKQAAGTWKVMAWSRES